MALDDSDSYWRRLDGIDRPLTNERAWRNFGLFAVLAIVSMAALFGLLVLAAWITS